jgi:uncharacterized delta-60 repeat protein
MTNGKASDDHNTLAAPELDSSFALQGTAHIPHPKNPLLMLNVTLVAADPNTDANQKIYAACLVSVTGEEHTYQPYLVRLLTDGQIDSSFGEQGYVTLPVQRGGGAPLSKLLFFTDTGAITCFTEMLNFATHYVPAAVRVTSSGMLDTSFVPSGWREYPPPWWAKSERETTIAENADISGVAASPEQNRTSPTPLLPVQATTQPSGKILFVANYRNTSGVAPVASYLGRIDLNGHPDESFGRFGFVKIEDPAEPDTLMFCRVHDIDRRGAMVLASQRRSSGIVLRYDSEGSLDHSFGNDGIVEIPDAVRGCEAKAIKALDDGKIIVLFDFANKETGTYHPAIIKLLPDGERDSTFNNGLPVEIDDLSHLSLVSFNMNIDDGNRILISSRIDGGGPDMDRSGCLSRLMPNGTRDEAFGKNGVAVRQDLLGFYSTSIQDRTKILSQAAVTQLRLTDVIARFIA